MEKNNPRFYYALGALSLFALALFQGAQFFTSQYESQVLGWNSMFQNFNRSANTAPAYTGGQPISVPTKTSIAPLLPSGFQINQWQSYMGTNGGAMRTKLGLGKGISCTTAMELFDTLCTDGTITRDEFGQTRDDYVQDLRAQAAQNDPRDPSSGRFIDQYLPSGMPSRNVTGAQGVQTQGPLANGLSCETIKTLLDTQAVCTDGTISREEIRSVTSQLKPAKLTTPGLRGTIVPVVTRTLPTVGIDPPPPAN